MVGTVIKRRRAVKRMTQAQLAKALGTRQGSVSCWERGMCAPNAASAARLQYVLGGTIEDYLK